MCENYRLGEDIKQLIIKYIQIDSKMHQFDNESEPLTGKRPKSNAINIQDGSVLNSELNREHLEEVIDTRKKKIKYAIIGGVALIAVTLAIVLPLTLRKKPQPKPPTPGVPEDTNPYYIDVTQETNTAFSRQGFLYFKDPNKTKIDIGLDVETQNFLLEQQAKGKIGVNWTKSLSFGANNPLVKKLSYQFDMIDFQVARFLLTDSENDRFTIPDEVLARPPVNKNMRLDMVGHAFKSSESAANHSFSFSFFDNEQKDNIFVTTENQTLIFSDKYIQMDFLLPTDEHYGFGERMSTHRLKEGAWGMWASGRTDQMNFDNGLGRGGQYGVHPFLLTKSKDSSKYMGMYFRNANAQLPIIRYIDGVQRSTVLSYITLGGELEVYFFISGSARQVIQDYHRVFGKPQLPPFWSLGWQEASQTVWNATQDRDNQLNLIRTVEHYHNLSLPLDTVYLDYKMASFKRNFDINNELISNVTDLKFVLTTYKTKMIAFIDSTVYAPESVDPIKSDNPTYIEGLKADIFIKSAVQKNTKYNGYLVSLRYPKMCVYIDWFNYDAVQAFWSQQIAQYYDIVPFDGLWTFANEAYSDKQGELNLTASVSTEEMAPQRRLMANNGSDFDTDWFTVMNVNASNTFDLPFTPQFKQNGSYDQNSASLNATHSNFKYWNNIENKWMTKSEQEYNLHSLYGHAMIMTTSKGVSKLAQSAQSPLNNKRPFLLTRATYTSTNQYSSYAIKYKYRNWASLQNAIPHVMNMNMFGFAHTGADACGSIDKDHQTEMNEELCLRWIQLSTFFPLARHSQEFNLNSSYVTGPLGFKNNSVGSDVWLTMRDRMQYLRFMYTCLFEASEFGGSCFDPVYFHYPNDQKSREETHGVNDTFIFGGAVKVSPLVTSAVKGTKTFKSYFPKGRWLNLATLETKEGVADGMIDLNIQPTVNVHLRPGSIIPWQNFTNTSIPVKTTEDVMGKPISLVINRNEGKYAKGTLFLDDGISQSELAQKTYEYYTVEHKSSQTIQITLQQGKKGAQDQRHSLDTIVIGDADDIADSDFACVHSTSGEIDQLVTSYDPKTKSLSIYREANQDEKGLAFSILSNIYYGKRGKHLDLCTVEDFAYNATAGSLDQLQYNNATFKLSHKGGVLPDLKLTLKIFDEDVINVKWTWWDAPPKGKRPHFDIPDVLVNTSRPAMANRVLYSYVNVTLDPFTVQIFTVENETQVTMLEIDRFVYDFYLNWIGMKAFQEKGTSFKGIMGLGERSQADLFYKDGVYSMWGYDDPTKAEDGVLPGKQGYGTHPFFMFKNADDRWLGVYSNHAQAQDWMIKNNAAQGTTVVKQISTGSVSDLFVMINARTPDEVVGKYQKIVGKPVLMPQWTLGFHTCKYCLRSVKEYEEVIQGYRNAKIPIDAQWGDIDYMHNYQNFKVDLLYFGDLKDYVDRNYHNNQTWHLKFVPIVDAGIAARPLGNYSTYTTGVAKDVFLKSPVDKKENFIGKVWPNQAAFPDFFHPNTAQWWHDELTQFQKNQVWFDGIWLDMNEAANFCNGACLEKQKPSSSMLDNLYYTPTGRSLESKSLSIDIQHANGMSQLDTHNLFGSHQIKTTYDWFKAKNATRPYIVGRSTFAGVGKFAGKWLGDSSSTYEDMQRSVTGSMMMNMFGVPYVGGDICGFTGPNAQPELCTRWHQVGSFQPFSRNHRDCLGKPQEPFRFVNYTIDGMTYTDIMKRAIQQKYSLLRYYYTHLFLLSQDDSSVGTFYKPVFFEFPNDDVALNANPSENIMLGPSLKLSIKTTENKNWSTDKNTYYFPKGIWCDILTPSSDCITVTGESEMQVQPAGLKDYQLHIRDGHIIPYQDARAVSSSEDLQYMPVDFIISPTNKTQNSSVIVWEASGVYVNDNGNSTEVRNNFNKYNIQFSYVDVVNNETDDETVTLKFITKEGERANNYYNNETKCMKVNQNDILGGIYIYDEFEFFANKGYQVFLTRTDRTYVSLGTAKYNSMKNMMEYVGLKNPETVPEVCLNYILEITFKPAITAAAASA